MCERVIANLVDNALKQGGLQQDVRIVADHDATQLRLCVRNSGSRFPDDAQSLLQAFTRGQRSDRTAGFGIGLATTQAVIAAHGGEVTLRNRDGFAEVELRLPLPTEPAPTLPDGGRP
jgi:signal transduction histidine kinase